MSITLIIQNRTVPVIKLEPQGLPGMRGKSAYQVAVDNGFVGTESQWLASLVGPDGLSAYQVAVNNGFVGTESQWLVSLVGPGGLSAYQVAVNNGFVGTESQWLTSLIGAAGASAYQVAVNNGFVGTESQWLASLIGASGLSAYQVAVNNGFVGTEAQWLASLVGPPGTTDWAGISNKPSTFTPSTHGHGIGDVSGLQAALNAAANVVIRDSVSATHTGNTNNTLLKALLIPANSLTVGDMFEYIVNFFQTGVSGTQTLRFYVNTSANLSGATLLGMFTTASAVGYLSYSRINNIIASNQTIVSNNTVTSIAVAQHQIGGVGFNTLNIDWTVDQYFIVATQLSANGVITTYQSMYLTKR